MGGAQAMLDALNRMDLVFGIFYEPPNFKLGNNDNPLSTMKDDEIPSEVVTLMKQVFGGDDMFNFLDFSNVLIAFLSETGSKEG